MEKRWIGLVMALSTFFTFFACSLSVAGTETNEELILNGGFESVDASGKPECPHNSVLETNGWITGAEEWGQYLFVDSKEKHSGSNSLRIEDKDGTEQPFAAYWVYNAVPGAEYELSTWMKVDVETKKKGAGYKVEFRKKDGTSCGEGVQGADDVVTTNGWVQKKWKFTAPLNVYKIKVYLRLYKPGTAWFDDVSLKRISADAPPFQLMTDNVFYYTDRTEPCHAEITMIDALVAYYDIEFPNELYADFYVQNQSGIFRHSARQPVVDGKAEFNFPLSCLTKGEEHTVFVTIEDIEENIYTAQQVIELVDRPTALLPDGTYRRGHFSEDGSTFLPDDAPFYPVMAYHAWDVPTDPDILPALKQIGVNVVQTVNTNKPEELKKWLDALDAADMMGLVCLYYKMKPAAHPDNVENTRALMEVAAKHPATFAYALMDEPSSGETYAQSERDSLIRASYKLVRGLDPHRPTYFCDYLSLVDMARYPDIFCVDRYSIYEYGMNVETVKTSTMGQKPVYTLMRCHTSSANTEPTTAAQLKYMFYDGLMAGAQGVGFSSYDNGGDNGIEYFTELKEGILAMQASGEMDAAYRTFLKSVPYRGTAANGIKWTLSADKKHLVLLNAEAYAKTASVPELFGMDWAAFKAGIFGETAEEYHYSTSFKVPKESTMVLSLEALAEGTAPIFTDADGKYITSLPHGETVLAESIYKAEYETAMLVFALYKNTGNCTELFDVAFGTVSKTEDGKEWLRASLQMPVTGTYEVRSFILKNGTLCPLTGARNLI